MADKNYITPAGFKRLTDELNWLNNVERPRVTREVSEAAAEGDRSENAAYIYGKRRLREIDRRMGFLQRRVDNANVVDVTKLRKDRVFFGAIVDVEDADGESARYRIVGVDEVDAPAGKISWKSPVGRALLGKEVDDSVMVRWHAGERELTIVEIRYEVLKEKDWTPPPAAWRPPAEEKARADANAKPNVNANANAKPNVNANANAKPNVNVNAKPNANAKPSAKKPKAKTKD